MSLEAVNEHGKLFVVPRDKAREFARWARVKEGQNFSRAVDPHHIDHQFCERWQGIHNVRFIEKVSDDGVLEWMVVWGQPKAQHARVLRAVHT